jgi:nucleoside-diphosphate-sugar epimerase
VDITYVQNAAQAHIDAAEKLITAPEKINGRVFYISDGNPVRIWDWINSLLKECGIPEISRKIPYRKAYALGGILEAVFRFLPFGEPPMTCFAAGQLAHSHYFDISAAKKELGYKPPVASGEAFRATVEWLKKKQAKENDLYRPRCFPGE